MTDIGDSTVTKRQFEANAAGTSSHYQHSAKDMNIQKIRDRANRLKLDLMEGFERQLQELIDDFVQEVEDIEQVPSCNGPTKSVKLKRGELLEKEFIARRSVLSELLEISHIRTIYHIFVAILIVFMLNTFVSDIMERGRIVLDFDLIVWTFGKFPLVISAWLVMALSASVLVYLVFQYWAYNRRPTPRPYWVDFIMLAVYIFYQVCFFVFPLRTIIHHQLPTASAVVVVSEQIRLMMKAHAFVRENIPRAMQCTKKQDDNDGDQHLPCPDFSKYLYFLFAPTLVYRDVYPRNTGGVRWNYVVSNLIQVLASLFYMYYIFERFCIPMFRDFTSDYVTPRRLIVSIFGCILPGTLVLFISFFSILHSWLNAFAEMLCFADRLFYKDWWNSSTFANYYRTWNVVVHDWLYCYVYKECYLLLGKRQRALPLVCVFLLSAVFHEYILTVTFGFFYPVLFFMFAGAGCAFVFLPNKSGRTGNVFMWVALFIGNGMLMCFYSMEWYARRRCPAKDNFYMDLLLPRTWTCNLTGSSNITSALSSSSALLHSEL